MATATKAKQFVRTSVGNVNATVEVPPGLLDSIRKKAISKARKQLRTLRKEIVTYLYDDVIDQFDGHDLKELRKMGHPFGRTQPQNIDSPWYTVHTQSGKLFGQYGERTIFKEGVTESKSYLKVWLKIDNTYHTIGTKSGELPLAGMIHHGTSKMRPRPFLTLGTVEYLRAKSMLR